MLHVSLVPCRAWLEGTLHLGTVHSSSAPALYWNALPLLDLWQAKQLQSFLSIGRIWTEEFHKMMETSPVARVRKAGAWAQVREDDKGSALALHLALLGLLTFGLVQIRLLLHSSLCSISPRATTSTSNKFSVPLLLSLVMMMSPSELSGDTHSLSTHLWRAITFGLIFLPNFVIPVGFQRNELRSKVSCIANRHLKRTPHSALELPYTE